MWLQMTQPSGWTDIFFDEETRSYEAKSFSEMDSSQLAVSMLREESIHDTDKIEHHSLRFIKLL